MVSVRRALSLLVCAAVVAVASTLSVRVFLADGTHWLDILRVVLVAVNTAWLSWGAAVALNGLLSRSRPASPAAEPLPSASVAVLVPVYNEDPVKTFSHVAAMARSLAGIGASDKFHFAILSDTDKELVAQREEFWFARLKAEFAEEVRFFYRRRPDNTGKKAGNIADFIRNSGAIYDYLVILDADSLMRGETLVEMVRRMEADPQLGLLQTLPKVIHARALFGRAVGFASSLYSPVHARGVAAMQGDAGPFWGHNTIVRTRAFAQSCGLPKLSGRPPFGGHILSHDFVEAALLARNGWKVRLDPDLDGSYEEGPDNIVDYARRDRRWCQGNLQHARILTAPGLLPWSRFFLLQGIMAYVASPIWVLFLIASIIAHVEIGAPDYFSPAGLPIFPRVEHVEALTLLTGIFGLLIGPKLLVVLRGALTGENRAFGGTLRVTVSSLVEIVTSTLLAPIMLLYQTRSVLQVLLGVDAGWPAANRESNAVGRVEAWFASWWICALGCFAFGTVYGFAPEILPWVMLVAAPAILAPFLIQQTSKPWLGDRIRALGLLATPEETPELSVIREQEAILAHWRTDAMPLGEHPVAGSAEAPDVVRMRAGMLDS